MQHIRLSSLFVSALAVSGAWAQAPAHQALEPRRLADKSMDFSLANLGLTNKVIVKVRDDSGSRLVDGRLRGTGGGGDLSYLIARLEGEPGIEISPLLSIQPTQLADLRLEGQNRSGRALADLSEFWSIKVAPETDVTRLVFDLLALDVVENAYVAPRLSQDAALSVPPSVMPQGGPPLEDGHRAAAPGGVDADWANSQVNSGEPGGQGVDVTILDLETAWPIEHNSKNSPGSSGNWIGIPRADLGPTTVPMEVVFQNWVKNLYPIADPRTWATGAYFDFTLNQFVCDESLVSNHGSWVLGILTAEYDGMMTEGLAPQADVLCLSPRTMFDPMAECELPNGGTTCSSQIPLGGYCPSTFEDHYPDAFVLAALALVPGDVLLIEQHIPGPNSTEDPTTYTNVQFGFVPLEFWPAEFECIRQLTALGIHVVEPAGNGEQDLDDTSMSINGDPAYGPAFGIPGRDSGAILVGAGSYDSTHWKMEFSNSGQRVDTYAWGENVNGILGQEGTGFSGTSSASAIVASCVAVIESTHEQRFGTPMDPIKLRAIIRNSGTPSVTDESTQAEFVQELIGRQIDLRDTLGLMRISQSTGEAVSSPALSIMGGVGTVAVPTPSAGRVGNVVDFIGDIDFDGIDDVAVGAPVGDPGTFPDQGWVFTYSGRTGRRIGARRSTVGYGAAVAGCTQYDENEPETPVDHLLVVASTDGSGTIWSYGSTGSSASLGMTGIIHIEVENIGDVDSDYWDDLAVGFVNSSGDGRVLVLSGANLNVVLGQLDDTNPTSRFGWAVVALGDVSNDMVPDFAVSAPDAAGSTGYDLVTFFSGADRTVLPIVWPGSTFGAVGEFMCALPDVDEPGSVAIVVSANSYGGGIGQVSVYQVFPNGLSNEISVTTEFPVTSVANAGDWDDDDIPEFAYGMATSGSGAAIDSGLVEVFPIAPGSELLHSFAGPTPYSYLGQTLAGGGDLNGDGLTDLLIGAPGSSGGYEGHVYGFLTNPVAPVGGVNPPGATLVASPPYIEYIEPNQQFAAGSPSALHIDFGVEHKDKLFMVLASASGSEPGFDDQTTGVHVPINPFCTNGSCSGTLDPLWVRTWSAFTAPDPNDPDRGSCQTPTQWPVKFFQGVLSKNGRRTVYFGPFPRVDCEPIPADPIWAEGREYTFVAVVLDIPVPCLDPFGSVVFEAASNPVTITVIDETTELVKTDCPPQ